MLRQILKLIFILCIGINFTSCKNAATKDCRKFSFGNFILHDKKSSREFLIKRFDSTQIETEISSGKVSEWKITWVTDCKYNLYLLRDDYEMLKNSKEVPSPTFEIITATEKYYVFKQEFSLFSNGYIDTIWRAE